MLERRPLDRQVRDLLLDRIVRGELPPGENLVETRLSEELGVSRTPLRAALAGLERDGLVVSRPGHGWSVAPLDPAEAADLYPILNALEALALRTAGIPPAPVLGRLAAINAEIGAAGPDPVRAVERNLAWHETLVSGCGNRPLLELLESARRKVTRYEYAFFGRGTAGVGASREHHERIARALRAGDMEAAVRALRDHWLSDLEFAWPPPETEGERAATAFPSTSEGAP